MMFKRQLISIRYCLAVTILCVLVSCGKRADTSRLDYAISSGSLSIGGPVGRIELLNRKLAADFSTIKVCVQIPSGSVSKEDFVLETKLAHAVWLRSAGYGAADFARFEFVTQHKCSKDDVQYSSVVAIADFNRESPYDHFRSLFNEPRIRCSINAQNLKGCTLSSISLGWGGPGSYRAFIYPSAPTVWVRIENERPSSVLLSPYIDWMPLSEILTSNAISSGTNLSGISNGWQNLRRKNNVTFDDLYLFGDTLATDKVLASRDQTFDARTKAFYNSTDISVDETIIPKLARFRTLLHEIGHTFGLEHADNPSSAITGPSPLTRWDPRRMQHLTPQSCMAYGDHYLYLTDDDKVGAAAAAAETRRDIQTHF